MTPIFKLGVKSSRKGIIRLNSSLVRNPRTGYPQYSVRGEKNMLGFKMIPPVFRCVKGDAIAVEGGKKGRMLLEFTPSDAQGAYDWNNQVRIALSAEEVGLFCNQLPHHPIEIIRATFPSYPGGEEDDSRYGAITNDEPDKVLKITPGEGASVLFALDFMKNGVGGQSELGPLEVATQAGEFEIILAIMRTSLPVLAGWSPLIDIAIQSSINDAMQGGYGQSPRPDGASAGGGGFF